MLKKLVVKNFKCFGDLTFDLTAADYSFNQELIKDGVVNKALIYGKNGTGKSSLGFAVVDLIQHLTDTQPIPPVYTNYYANMNSSVSDVTFQYTFSFNFKDVVYEYRKTAEKELIYEKLEADGEELADYHYNSDRKYIAPALQGNLNIQLPDNKLSILKYIYRNTPTGTFPLLTQLMKFCEGMLWFRSLSDGNSYSGLINGQRTLDKMLLESGKLFEFQEFLHKCGIPYELDFEKEGDDPVLYVYFAGKKKKAPFRVVASSGTRVLLLFFVWLVMGKDRLSLLFIDEFDAFYHYEVAAMVVKELNQFRNFQSILTTHNTYLMQNEFTRPDCCFLLTEQGLKSLKKSSEREIREAHNLEKMYINGAFIS